MMTEAVNGEAGMTDRRVVEDDISGRTVMGRGVVEIDGVCHGVRVVKADLREDLAVVLRLDVVRGPDITEVELGGPLHALPGGASFEAPLPGGGVVRVRPLDSSDASWLLESPIEGLSSEDLSRVLAAYDLAAGTDGDHGPWPGGDEPVEVVTLVLDAGDDHAVALGYSAYSPYHEDAGTDSCLELWRVGGRWQPGEPREAVGEAWIVDPGMLAVVLELFDHGRVIPRVAALLAGWGTESTLVGMDPFAGRIRRRMDSDLDNGIRALLVRAAERGVSTEDVEYLAKVLDVEFQVSNLDTALMAWPEQVLSAISKVASAIAVEESEVSDWSPDGAQKWEWGTWWWTDMGLIAPAVPATCAGPLLVSSSAEVWSTTDKFPSWTVYGPFNLAESFAHAVEENTVGELFMAGHAGHGINSWGLGIVASFDAFIVAIQVHYGGAYPSAHFRESALHMIGAWDMFVAGVERLRRVHSRKRPDQPRWLIRYSDFRQAARVSVWDAFIRRPGGVGAWVPVFDLSLEGRDGSSTPLADPADWSAERSLAEALVTALAEHERRVREAPSPRSDSSD